MAFMIIILKKVVILREVYTIARQIKEQLLSMLL
jgi:hypothetical protein